MGRSSSGAPARRGPEGAARVAHATGPPSADRLVAIALLQALHPAAGGWRLSAERLALLARDHPAALDRAVARVLRGEQGRPTAVTAAATASLRLARALVADADPAGRRQGLR